MIVASVDRVRAGVLDARIGDAAEGLAPEDMPATDPAVTGRFLR